MVFDKGVEKSIPFFIPAVLLYFPPVSAAGFLAVTVGISKQIYEY